MKPSTKTGDPVVQAFGRSGGFSRLAVSLEAIIIR
jgi:hypothetical protein